MPENLSFYTRRLLMRIVDETAAPAVLDYYLRNREFHQPWFAARGDQVFTLKQQQINLANEHADFLAGRCVPFWLSLNSEPSRIIGRVASTNIVRGCFDSGFMAWHLDQHCQGSGLGAEAGQAAISVLFGDFRLHRLEANIMPGNARSIALAERLGFRLEGLSPRYLKINGRWEDHLHFVRLADDKPADPDNPELTVGFLTIRRLRPADVAAALAYQARNQEHLYTWNPAPDADLSSASGWLKMIADSRSGWGGPRLDLGIFLADRPGQMVGTVECRNIRPLPFSSCEIGFSLDRLLTGRGLMPEVLSQVIGWLFARYGLQRVTAHCCADHEKSIRLLGLLGFHQEGRLRRALYLHDQWTDLISLALLREDFHPVESPAAGSSADASFPG